MGESLKICRRCDEAKPLIEFHRTHSEPDGRKNCCKACVSEQSRQWRKANLEKVREADRCRHAATREKRNEKNRRWRERNPERTRENKRRQREAVRALINKAKNRPCVDCGEQLEPKLMHFDHVRGEKLFTIGDAKRSVERTKVEIAKCAVRCAPCHQERHRLEQLAGAV